MISENDHKVIKNNDSYHVVITTPDHLKPLKKPHSKLIGTRDLLMLELYVSQNYEKKEIFLVIRFENTNNSGVILHNPKVDIIKDMNNRPKTQYVMRKNIRKVDTQDTLENIIKHNYILNNFRKPEDFENFKFPYTAKQTSKTTERILLGKRMKPFLPVFMALRGIGIENIKFTGDINNKVD